MRRQTALLKWMTSFAGVTALLTMGGAAHAQLPIDLLDWVSDRGHGSFFGLPASPNAVATRPGYNDFVSAQNSPGPAVPRFNFPATRDIRGTLNATGSPPTNMVVDNPNAADVLNQPRNQPVIGIPLRNPSSELRPSPNDPVAPIKWLIPAPANRAPAGGFSFTFDPAFDYNFDYAYVDAVHDDFVVTRDGADTPASRAELAALPNALPAVYRAVHNRLVAADAQNEPVARYSSGSLAPGRYGIEIYSPGDGTLVNNLPRPVVSRALVRVSWRNTVNGGGGFNVAGINDVVNSRIFIVNLGAAGWIRLTDGNGNPAEITSPITYTGNTPNNGNDQIVVSIYSVTPDALTGGIYVNPPIVTADAVRFTPTALPTSPGLSKTTVNGTVEIAAAGRILGPAISTGKIPGVPDPGNAQPLHFFAREESVPESQLDDSAWRSRVDPTNEASAVAPDPTGAATRPVFYCIDNRRGDTASATALGQPILSIEKLRWRFVGVPADSTGTASASALLANTRCRDGLIRPMVYFVTTTASGSVGRIYALDPVGDPTTCTTRAFWAYPSERPLLENVSTTNFPPQFNDPNYRRGSNVPAIQAAYGALPTFGADQTVATPIPGSPNVFYYDGDLATNPIDQNVYIVRSDTRVTLGGVQASPMLIDDPSNLGGAQLLIVGDRNGRLFAFDAGGRGDFGNVADTTAAGGARTVAGTTQRIWAWPQLGADAFRYRAAALQDSTNTIQNEASVTAFAATPSYDASTNRIVVGAADGRLYGLLSNRDVFRAVVANRGQWDERRVWQYPSANGTLGTSPSTAAIFTPATGDRIAYFTAGGRVYAVNISQLPGGTAPVTANLAWVYPYTPNPPQPVENDASTTALDPGFNGSAPITVRLNFNGADRDLCYVLQGDGTVRVLDAVGAGGATTQLAAGNSVTRNFTRCSPIIAQIRPQSALLTGNAPIPAIVFADDSGVIQAVGADAIPDGNGNDVLLPLIWRWQDGNGARGASAIASNGTLLQGDEGGQMRAYSFGLGADGLIPSLGAGEPLPAVPGNGAVTIDLRGVDLYASQDYENFMLSPDSAANRGNARTPAPGYNASATPLPGNVVGGSNARAFEWGDFILVAAWGVYHAKPPVGNGLGTAYGLSSPRITVTFNISQPNTSGRGNPPPRIVTVPATSPEGAPFWPNDLGVPAGTNLTIFGTDPNNPEGPPGQRTGNAEGVYPWVAVVRVPRNGIHIRPDANNPYTPGSTGLHITASAQIEQQIGRIAPPGGDPGATRATDISSTLALGQRDAQGKSNSLNQASPNQQNLVGQERRIFIAHPFSLTVRGHNNQSNLTTQPNVIGWGPDLGFVPANGRGEMLANGNRVVLDANAGTSVLKPLFAPIGSIPDGSTQSYFIVNPANGAKLPALFVTDRSNLVRTTGTRLGIKAHTRDVRWFGGATSVMNPQPWEQLPTDALATPDYPNIPAQNLVINGPNGQSLADAAEEDPPALAQPVYSNPNNTASRQPIPTPLELSVQVPLYQPANINFGLVAGQRPFGSGYRDISGRLRGGDGLSDPIIGPLNGGTGLPVPVNNNVYPASPAGGYVSEIIIRAAVRGLAAPPFSGQDLFNDFRNPQLAGAAGPPQAYRGFELGLSVPPRQKMRVEEPTIDLGSLAHGAGYSDMNGGAFNAPFAPTGSLPWGANASPWDTYFRPFTLVNESNVNLVAPRIAKLIAPAGTLNAGTLLAASAKIGSENVDNLVNLPLIAAGFNSLSIGLGNIGLVSSFDHVNGSSGVYRELPLWPLPNPYVTAGGVTNAGLAQVPNHNNGPVWAAGVQPYPTVHKPRVGDRQGVVATIPDTPHDANAADFANFATTRPKVGMAIPLGTPSGEYAANIFAFEDNTPFQWRRWLELSRNVSLNNVLADRDGVMNTNVNNGQPLETFTDPTFNLRVKVTEARLTAGVMPGSLSQVDFPTNPLAAMDNWLFPRTSGNMLPAALPVYNTGQPNNSLMALYWATNRQPAGIPTADSNWLLAYSLLPMPGGDFNFARPGGSGRTNAGWWSNLNLFRGLDNGANPATLAYLFPSTRAEAQAAAVGGATPPFQEGNRVPTTERHGSPAAVTAVNLANPNDSEAVLAWIGNIDKVRGTGQSAFQLTESRTFYTTLQNGAPNGPTLSFLNDPALTKLSPKPLLLKIGNQKFFYIFWHAGNRSQTKLYYNFNAVSGLNTAFLPTGWSQDQALPTPGALAWQSDPYPVYRRSVTVRDPITGQSVVVNDVIDIVYTGVLKNQSQVELLLSRYRIRRGLPGETGPLGSLELLATPTVWQETARRSRGNDTFTARDAGWFLTNDRNGTIRIELLQAGQANPTLLNRRQDGTVQNGRYDQASGLVYFDSTLGGQIVVDPNSGSIYFPNVAPKPSETLLLTYIPQVMRLSVPRDEPNLDYSTGSPFGAFARDDVGLKALSSKAAPGNYSGPVALMDRTPNPRAAFVSPRVVFAPNNVTPTVDRLWLVYRRLDASKGGASAIFYKSLRLMVRLPRPIALTARDANGNQQIANLTVAPADGGGALGPYEVDWVRGRIYFSEQDESRTVRVNYTALQSNGQFNSGNLVYVVGWGDEMDGGVDTGISNSVGFTYYKAKPEATMPSQTAVSEGQVAAFRDPLSDKVWVFWSSMRGGTADLFYQTISPQFYPITPGQR